MRITKKYTYLVELDEEELNIFDSLLHILKSKFYQERGQEPYKMVKSLVDEIERAKKE